MDRPMTRQPRSRIRFATSTPMPELAPVTTAVKSPSLILCSPDSHEQLDVAERGVEVDQVDALEDDLQRTVREPQLVARPAGVHRPFVAARLRVVEWSPGAIAVF